MAIKKAVQIGEPVIRKVAIAIKNPLAPSTRKIVKDLTDSMRSMGLVGMAAPQIGSGTRIFVVELRKTKARKDLDTSPLHIFINPKITSYSKKMVVGYEGCGSIAYGELFGPVKRSQSVMIEALGVDGKPFKLSAKGMLARVIQHENDHLNGVVFLDKVTDTRKLVSRDYFIKHKPK